MKLSILMLGICLTLFVAVPVHAQTTPTPTVSPTVKPTNRAQTVAELRQAALKRAKTVASKIFQNHFLTKLNALRIRIANNTKLGADARQVLLEKVDAELSWFSDQAGKVNDATTIEQVRTTTREARIRFAQLGKDVRKLYYSSAYVVSLEKVIKRLEESTLPKISAKLVELNSNGIDVTVEQSLLDKAKAELAAAKNEITEIRNSTTFEIAKKNYDEARAHLKTAKESLKQLLESLKAKL